MVALQVIVTSYLTVSLLVASPEHRIRDQCLGNYMIHYTRYFPFFYFFQFKFYDTYAEMPEMGGGQLFPKFFADQLTLIQPDFTHHITTGP